MSLFITDGLFLTNNEKFDQCYLPQNITSDVSQSKLKPLYLWTLDHLGEATVLSLFYFQLIMKAIGFLNLTELTG